MASLAGASIRWTSTDAQAATKLARALHVEGPWLARSREHLDQETLAALEDARLERAARNAWIVAAAQSSSATLARASVPHRIVKGVALLPWLAHPGDRWLDDVDILVSAADRLVAVDALRAAGLQPVRHLRHNGSLSDPLHDGGSTVWEDASGVTVDVHFVRAPLPELAAHDRDALPRVSPAALAIGLSNHVVLHHALAHRFCARHITDLRALLDAGHEAALAEASQREPALRRSLAYMRSLGVPGLDFVAARDLPLGGDIRDHARAALRRARSLAVTGDLVGSVFPSRIYLEALLGDKASPTLALHWKRWKRIAGRARAGG